MKSHSAAWTSVAPATSWNSSCLRTGSVLPLHLQAHVGFERSAPLWNIISVEHQFGSSGIPGWNNPPSSADVLTAATRPWSRYYTSITRVSWPARRHRSARWTHVLSRCLHPILDTLRGTWGRGGAPMGRPVEINLIRRLWRQHIWNFHHFLSSANPNHGVPNRENAQSSNGMRDRLFSSAGVLYLLRLPHQSTRRRRQCCTATHSLVKLREKKQQHNSCLLGSLRVRCQRRDTLPAQIFQIRRPPVARQVKCNQPQSLFGRRRQHQHTE